MWSKKPPEEWEDCEGYAWDSIEWAAGWNTEECCVLRKIFLDNEQVQEYESWWASACINVKVNGVSWKYMWNSWGQAMWAKVLHPLYDFEHMWVSQWAKHVTAECRELGDWEYVLNDYEWDIPAFGWGNYISTTEDGLYRWMNYDPPKWEDFLYIFLPPKFRVPNSCAETYYHYKRITSWVEHESPTNRETWSQIQAMITSSLPIDNERYIDFIWTTRGYHSVDYFKWFREETPSEREFDSEAISDNLTDELSVLEDSRNKARDEVDFDDLWWQALQIYTLLKTWEIPKEQLDVKKIFWSEEMWWELENWEFPMDWDTKELHYWDVFTHNIYMKNMQTITEKYRYVFENFLNDQFWNDYKYFLPKNKKIYEITYMWAPWDYQNMYIKVDSEEKEDNPYAETISENMVLDTYMKSSNNVSGSDKSWNSDETWNSESLETGWEVSWWGFSCWATEWTPIRSWMSSVNCWLWESLTPKISFPSTSSNSDYSSSKDNDSSDSEENEEYSVEPINAISYEPTETTDYTENFSGSFQSINLNFNTDLSKYYYNSKWTITVKATGLSSDRVNYINFILDKLEKVWDSKEIIYSSSSKNSEYDYDNALKYINFSDIKVRINKGKAETFFSTKTDDINVSFKAIVETKNSVWEMETILEWPSLEVQVRWEKLSMKSYKMTNSWEIDLSLWEDSIKVSDEINIFLLDTDKQDLYNLSWVIDSYSEAYEKMIISVDWYSKNDENFEMTYPLRVDIFQDGKLTFAETGINESSLSEFKPLTAIQKSGDFDIIITDNKGYNITKSLTMIPEEAFNVDISLSPKIIETGRVLTKHDIILLDKFGNLASGYSYDIDIEIDWEGVVFYNEDTWEYEKETSLKTLKWYEKFSLISTDEEDLNIISFKIKNDKWKKIVDTTDTINTQTGILVEITAPEKVYVWETENTFSLEVKDNEWNLLNEFNSKAYITVNTLYGEIQKSPIEIEEWKWDFTFVSKNLATKEAKIEFWVEWINTVFTKYFSILPDDPMIIELVLDEDNIEADENNYTKLQAILRDRYWNIAFDENSTNLVLNIPTNTGWTTPITWENKETLIDTPLEVTKTVKQWKTDFKIYATMYPWRWYFTVKTNQGSHDLSKNSFDLIWQNPFSGDKLKSVSGMLDWKKLSSNWEKFFIEVNSYEFQSRFHEKEKLLLDENFLSLKESVQGKLKKLWDETNKKKIYWVSKTAWTIETSYFWNKKAFKWKRYNWLYTVLLWAPYGDISKKDTLASDILFDPENRSISVTSILNNPYKYDDVIAVDKKGSLINLMEWAGTTTQDIRSEINQDSKDRLYIDLFNDSLSTYIWKVYYNFSDDGVNLLKCEEDSILDCIDEEKTSIIIESLSDDYSLEEEENKLALKDLYWRESLIIDNDWKVDRKSWIYLDIDEWNESKYLVLLIKSWENTIWRMLVNFSDAKIYITRDKSTLENKLKTLKNYTIVYLESKAYWTRDIWDRKIIFFKDPLSVEWELDDFHSDNPNGIENYLEKAGIWWEWDNKFMLSFTAWKSVWEATKDYMSFSLINLWDPVLKLKKFRKHF